MIKIGIDARMYGDAFTGIGRYTAELTKYFFEKKELNGQKIQWVIFLNKPEFSAFNFPKNVKKVCANAPHYSLAEQIKFLQILNTENCDLVHFTHFNVPFFYRKKFVVTIHDTTLSFFPGNVSWLRKVAYKLVISNAIKRANKIVAISENTKEDIQKLFKTPTKKIAKVLNGLTKDFRKVSTTEHQQICDKYRLPKEFLFYSGVWKSHKNLNTLFSSLAESRIKMPLVLTGTPDENLTNLAQKLNITDQIFTVGKVPFSDLVLLMGAAKIFVFPSLYEGFGLPPLEAMQAQTPVVCAKSSSLPEVCGEAVEFFNPLSTTDLTEKLEKVWNDKAIQSDLVKKGLLQIENFDWKRCAEKTWKTFVEILKNKQE